jgi:hypothetical protein
MKPTSYACLTGVIFLRRAGSVPAGTTGTIVMVNHEGAPDYLIEIDGGVLVPATHDDIMPEAELKAEAERMRKLDPDNPLIMPGTRFVPYAPILRARLEAHAARRAARKQAEAATREAPLAEEELTPSRAGTNPAADPVSVRTVTAPEDQPPPGIEPFAVAFRRIARHTLLQRGFQGDVEAEIDRLIRHGVPEFRFPQEFLDAVLGVTEP